MIQKHYLSTLFAITLFLSGTAFGAATAKNLVAAIITGNTAEATQILTTNPTFATEIDGNAQSALHFAAYHGNAEITQLLLKNGANVNAQDGNHNTPLHFASGGNHTEVMLILLGHPGVDVTLKNRDGHEPLTLSGVFDHMNNLETLSKAGTLPSLLTPQVARTMVQEIVKLNPAATAEDVQAGRDALLELGLDEEMQDADGKTIGDYMIEHNFATPFDRAQDAIRKGDVATLTQLIGLHHDLATAANKAGTTLLHTAARSGTPEVVDALIAAGLTVNAQDSKGNTPLHYAARTSEIQFIPQEKIQLLTDIASHPERDEELFGKNSSLKKVRSLLNAGADPDIENNERDEELFGKDRGRKAGNPCAKTSCGNIIGGSLTDEQHAISQLLKAKRAAEAGSTSGSANTSPQPDSSTSSTPPPSTSQPDSSTNSTAQSSQSTSTSSSTAPQTSGTPSTSTSSTTPPTSAPGSTSTNSSSSVSVTGPTSSTAATDSAKLFGVDKKIIQGTLAVPLVASIIATYKAWAATHKEITALTTRAARGDKEAEKILASGATHARLTQLWKKHKLALGTLAATTVAELATLLM